VFLLFRVVMELTVLLQEEIRKCCSKNNPVVGLMFSKGQRYYVPEKWLKYVEGEVGLERLLGWELGFQRYVAGERIKTVGEIDKEGVKREKFWAGLIWCYGVKRKLIKGYRVMKGLRK